jgi:hypothetical protein
MSATVEIVNSYACGRESRNVVSVRNPVPGESAEDWWEDAVYPCTGDGHDCGEREDAIYTATIVHIDDPYLSAGDSEEWG